MPDTNKPASLDRLFPAQEKVNVFYFVGRCCVFFLMVWTGFSLMAHMPSGNAAGQSFLHAVSLPFHEAGHIFFALLGDFMGVLGGSIMQVLIPVICLMAFFKKGDVFASSFALWWTGQNCIDLAPYIYDARTQKLILLGGVTGEDVPGYHDWNTILGDLGILKLDHAIAYIAQFTGSLLILSALTWGALILYAQGKNLDR